MPSLQGRFFNALIRQFIKRRYGNDVNAVAKQSRRFWGAPALWQQLHARGLRVQTIEEEKVSGEWLATERAASNTIFYIHGGGFVSCSARTHRPITAALARSTDFRVFSVNYRLAPEHRFPAALDDVFNAYRWLLGEQNIPSKKISLAGDSAGGGLVLSLLLRLRHAGLPLPACAVCFSPWTDLAGTGDSVRVNADCDDLFYPENIPEFAAAYLGETAAENALASPVFGDFDNLPPILFHVGSTEILLDDSLRIHQKIQAAGGTSELKIYDDLFHCWQMEIGMLPEARDSLQKAAEFIRRFQET
jgi:acetyl esterase/lipase